MRPDSLLGPVIHRAEFQGAFERSPSPFNFCNLFVILDNISAWRIHSSGFKEQEAIYFFFQSPAFSVRLDDDLTSWVSATWNNESKPLSRRQSLMRSY
jgi:hypothetical protein